MLQQQVAEQQAALSRLQSERDASERSFSQRNEDLQRQLAATQAQLHEQQAQLQEVQVRCLMRGTGTVGTQRAMPHCSSCFSSSSC